ncbi:hypothetical protein BKA70DRAFT_1451793 [Coprinopsis sp. MPI-PUGE-AT-0042]|nr:hypothetical protein BKA70DRAFT_1451793 [Coprinopsis sp. MPI-PUGE-AT-0042]
MARITSKLIANAQGGDVSSLERLTNSITGNNFVLSALEAFLIHFDPSKLRNACKMIDPPTVELIWKAVEGINICARSCDRTLELKHSSVERPLARFNDIVSCVSQISEELFDGGNGNCQRSAATFSQASIFELGQHTSAISPLSRMLDTLIAIRQKFNPSDLQSALITTLSMLDQPNRMADAIEAGLFPVIVDTIVRGPAGVKHRNMLVQTILSRVQGFSSFPKFVKAIHPAMEKAMAKAKASRLRENEDLRKLWDIMPLIAQRLSSVVTFLTRITTVLAITLVYSLGLARIVKVFLYLLVPAVMISAIAARRAAAEASASSSAATAATSQDDEHALQTLKSN